ncbi:Uncharacterised protein [Bordetella pertussis]|nr:Uncharacterised protein [Bordetella pertussis]CFO71285.1 Uncharacterised protein [Bordetella pertussis]CFU81970.1 Uncharacterised protein [Bordetella pertussis]CPI00756.1 Uncharacterised protein [Bordetella pertussis]CPL82332.1 Uncharacterised protein [Bordetella pertussis]
MPRLRASLISLAWRMLAVPEVEATVLPLRSSMVFRLADFRLMKRLPVTKVVTEKATCFWQSSVLDVEAHSRSMVPLPISGMRVAEVTGRYLTWISSRLMRVFTASTMRVQMSIE